MVDYGSEDDEPRKNDSAQGSSSSAIAVEDPAKNACATTERLSIAAEKINLAATRQESLLRVEATQLIRILLPEKARNRINTQNKIGTTTENDMVPAM